MPTQVLDRLSTLADSTRCRLLFVLDKHELTVGELATVLQLPQSTVSRHLKVLGDDGWVTSRAEGTSRYYRRQVKLADGAERLWDLVRDDVARTSTASEDLQRTASVLAARRARTKEFFTSAPPEWEALRRGLFGERHDAFTFLAMLDPRWTVGDLGCGTGQLTALIAPHVARVIGVDASDAMLAAAKGRLARLANVELRAGDLEALPLEPESLDIALMSLVLTYAAEPAAALREGYRVLKPGGRIVIMDMVSHAREELRTRMRHIWQGFGEEQMRTWLAEAGFTDVRFALLPIDDTSKGPGLFIATGSRAHT